MVSERSLLWLKPGLIFIVPLVIFGIVLLNRGGQSATVLSAWLSPDIPAQIKLPLGTASQIYGFRANPSAPTRLLLNTSSPAMSFMAEVRSSGERVAVLGGGLQNAMLTLGPGDNLYEVEFSANNDGAEGEVSLMVSDSQPASPVSVAPTPEPCRLSSALDTGVNIHTGPGGDHPVLTLLPRDTLLTPDAYSDNGWYRVAVNNQAGWVLGSVVNLHGSCQALLLSAPIPVLATPMTVADPASYCTISSGNYVNIRSGPGTSYTVIGTLSPGTALPASGQFDGWYLLSAGDQQGWVSGTVVSADGLCNLLPLVASATPLPVAPFDTSTFSLVTDRDASSQFSEVISYPDGDSGDLIQLSIANLYFQPPDNYREFTLSLNCAGPGAEYLRWGAPENPVNTCGSIITLPFLYDYSQHLLSVVLSHPGYVQYTLAATRL
jgi:uncharacterized protein YraI